MNDSGQIAQIEARLKDSSRKLHALAPQVGSAKQIRSFESDRRKNLLAKYVVRHLKAGESASAADSLARADEAYQAELAGLSQQSEGAEKAIALWDAEFASFEAARSLLAMSRETMRTLEG